MISIRRKVPSSCFAACLWAAVFASSLGAAPLMAAASDADGDRGRGFVDGSMLLDLAGDEGARVEISIKGPLLKLLSSACAREEEGMAEMIAGLESIHVLVLDVPESKRERARSTIRKMSDGLRKKGWEPVARVREDGAEVTVMMRGNESVIDGLVVTVGGGDGELVFVNIVGRVDLEKLSGLADRLEIPGLDRAFPKKGSGKARQVPAPKKNGTEKVKEKRSAGSDEDADGETDIHVRW